MIYSRLKRGNPKGAIIAHEDWLIGLKEKIV
jgi:hypothetical protein